MVPLKLYDFEIGQIVERTVSIHLMQSSKSKKDLNGEELLAIMKKAIYESIVQYHKSLGEFLNKNS